MPVAQVTVVPVGTPTASISEYVARCLDVLEESGLAFELTPMGTVIEGELGPILEAAARMHESAFAHGVVRVLTSVTVDERRDKELTMSGKLASVRRRRGG